VTRGTRPKKPSSSRDFTCGARGARGAWGSWGSWGLKTEIFSAGNNYQKRKEKKKTIYFSFNFSFERPRMQPVLKDSSLRPHGQKGEEGEEGSGVEEGEERVRPRGCTGASARTRVFYPQVLHYGRYSASKSQTTQRPSSIRPSVLYCPHDNAARHEHVERQHVPGANMSGANLRVPT
jgi:hypothetical protein